jgi:hypothetical protein
MKPLVNITNIYKCGSYLTENTPHLKYKEKIFDAVYGNNIYLF